MNFVIKSGARVKKVTSREPAFDFTPAGMMLSKTWPQPHRERSAIQCVSSSIRASIRASRSSTAVTDLSALPVGICVERPTQNPLSDWLPQPNGT